MYVYIHMAAGYFFYFGGLITYVSSLLAMLQFLITSIKINYAKTAIILHKNVLHFYILLV